jgi:hypothetical protein
MGTTPILFGQREMASKRRKYPALATPRPNLKARPSPVPSRERPPCPPPPSAYKIVDPSYVVVVGAGGSGLRATMDAGGKGLTTA